MIQHYVLDLPSGKIRQKILIKEIVSSSDKIYKSGFPRVVVLKSSTKGARSNSFRRAAYWSFWGKFANF